VGLHPSSLHKIRKSYSSYSYLGSLRHFKFADTEFNTLAEVFPWKICINLREIIKKKLLFPQNLRKIHYENINLVDIIFDYIFRKFCGNESHLMVLCTRKLNLMFSSFSSGRARGGNFKCSRKLVQNNFEYLDELETQKLRRRNTH